MWEENWKSKLQTLKICNDGAKKWANFNAGIYQQTQRIFICKHNTAVTSAAFDKKKRKKIPPDKQIIVELMQRSEKLSAFAFFVEIADLA